MPSSRQCCFDGKEDMPMARDVYRYINELDETTVRAVVDRLEFRGGDARFTAMREAYFDRLPLASAGLVLAVGCGTGVEMLALVRRAEFDGRVIGVDLSPTLVEKAAGWRRRKGSATGWSSTWVTRSASTCPTPASISCWRIRSSATSQSRCRCFAR